MGFAFLVLDWMTPGKLGEVICTPGASTRGALVSAASALRRRPDLCACIA